MEKYIEVAQYYPDLKERKQTDTSPILWAKEDTPKDKVLRNLATQLMLSFENQLEEEPSWFQ
ncbi:MAG: hypothetical protein MRERC_4c120 [Mycoplasmataceae bacterium RC_NB112A]|nr:MAG: hypothetical protein MRERC_4c120 [Mycoplasmataceae bacterium RC_NB112A]